MKKIVLLAALMSSLTICVSTLSELSSIASKRNEFPINNGSNWVYPSYKKMYESIAPSFINRIFGWQKPIIKQLNALLTDFIKNHTKNAYPNNATIRIEAAPESKYIIWSDLYGGFHSLMRGLHFLEKK